VCSLFACRSGNESLHLLVGAYSDGSTPGISVYRFNTQTGDFAFLNDLKGILNPSYLVVSPDEQTIYSVNETSDGAVSAFRIDKQSATLSFLNSQATGGADPCYINSNKGKTFIVTANYTGGNISVFPLSEDGTILPRTQSFDSPEPPASHLHTTVFSPDGKWLLATDLGKDKIYLFNLKSAEDTIFLKKEEEKTTQLESGSGPRHLVFHPNGKFLYCINELSGKIAAFHYHDGLLSNFQYIASDTTSGNGGKGSADIHIAPDGRFLYASNRLKADGIAIFSIHPETGRLTFIASQSTGIHPRNFIITPNGNFLLCANRDSNTIQIFKRNKRTGLLQDTEKCIQLNKPVCLQWISP
jgi:6-phosphogluconolactonase (cycloisomerase 2 family)